MNLPIKFGKKQKVYRNKNLNYLETKSIIEVERYPAYWTQEMVIEAATHTKWMDLGSDTAFITVGQYRSLLLPLI